ncbi:Heme A synthase, cytochrome oxidase biogenesis protein Cox15-CtaA [Candidatus Hydrogenisulfobacillus filiaventi]|uniref:Heme A synthase, cytochrome oxidase biogenesis protein Cox15-CtaA n=1 Tax=Candidatus Hydrogenisulfobacillus filiaventi TaxID=2707344 RepID=A0A6F8ZH98_9FIRM|nr:Heme A synthase, cytochrome oxidase biogenesis protein Cox15-CtaA [Candidatus Hydrogenisulfobacillus filiaventi]
MAEVAGRTPARWLIRVGWVSVVAIFLVNFVGFLDTITGSAFGCGNDWPLCNGAVIPSLGNIHVLIEFLHRAVVSVGAGLATLYAVWALVRYRVWLEVRWFAGLALAAILAQATLGALAVLFVNPPWVLALHFGISVLALTGILLLTVFLQQQAARSAFRQRPPSPGVRRGIRALLLYTFGAIYLGAYVASRGAAVACLTWPLCNGRLWPAAWTQRLALVEAHRLVAVSLAVWIAWLVVRTARERAQRPDLYRAAWLALVLVLTQAASGAYLVLSHLSVSAFMLHVSNMQGLFGTLAYLAYETWPAAAVSRAAEPGPVAAGAPAR